MTSNAEDLYGEVIVEHYKHPRNFRALSAGRSAEGHNPVCGDRLTVFVSIDNDLVKDVAFQGFGCAIATASASLMTEALANAPVADAVAFADRFEQMLAAAADAPVDDLGALTVFANVRRFPVRIKCATLPWHAFRAAAGASASVVSTE